MLIPKLLSQSLLNLSTTTIITTTTTTITTTSTTTTTTTTNSCPFDYVKVYDGPDNSSALIGTYCGQQRNLVLYSSESSLFVHFYTLPRTANTQNRGFKGIYEFSESFVKLDFIRKYHPAHGQCE